MEPQDPTRQELFEYLKNHWLYQLLGIAVLMITGTAGITWTVITDLSVQPKADRIQVLEKENADLKAKLATPATPPNAPLSPIVLPSTGIREHESVTTSDGECQISAETVFSSSARITVTVGSQEPVSFANAEVGKRLKVGRYFIDVLSITGNMVNVTVSKH